MRHFDKQGKPISFEEWGELFGDPDYQVIDVTGGAGHRVSTIWLGLDHSHGRGKPVIFETMVFGPDGDTVDSRRYHTLEEAKKGHAKLARKHAEPLDRIVDELVKLDNTMKVWTIQTAAAHEALTDEGELLGDWDRVDRDFKPSYYWLCDQMEQRDISLQGNPPIWGWDKKPDLRYSGHLERGTHGVRLELELPVANCLVSNFEAWHCVLNDHYLTTSDEEIDKAFARPCGYTPEEIYASWEKIFDLPYCVAADYHDRNQVTFPSIQLSQVRRTQAFRAR